MTQTQWLRLSDRDSEPGLTLKSLRPPPPPPPPITFKHEGRVPHKNPKSKTDLEWSPQPIQVDNDRENTGQSNMFKENIINIISLINIVKLRLSLALSCSSLAPFPNPYKEVYSKTTFRRRHLSNFSNQSAHSNFIIDQWHSSRQIRQGLHFQLSSFQRYNIHYSAFVAYSHFPNPHYPLLKLFSFQKAELESGKLKSTTLKAWCLYIEHHM